jgi:hypothetical protein
MFSFYVHRNGAVQNLYHNQYNRIMFTHANHNDFNCFDFVQARWIAPCDGNVHLSGYVMVLSGLSVGPQAALKFILNSTTGAPPAIPNGSDCFSPTTPVVTGNPMSWGGDGWWRVVEGDAVELAIQTQCPGNAGVLDGHRAHTYWSGAFFPD